MTGRFWVVGSFHIRSRKLFVLVGDLLEGKAEPGTTVCVRLGSLGVTTRIASLEVIDISYESRRYLGLALAYDEPGELEFWSALGLSNEEIELETLSLHESASSESPKP